MEDALAHKQIELLLEMHSKRLMKEIQSLHQELRDVKDQLSQQITRVRTAPQPQPQASVAQQFAQQSPPTPQAQPSSGPSMQQFQPQATAPSAQPIDRNGVAPEDVSIEKIFYMGNK